MLGMDLYIKFPLDHKIPQIQIFSYLGQFMINILSIQVVEMTINLIQVQLYFFQLSIQICSLFIQQIKIQKYLGRQHRVQHHCTSTHSPFYTFRSGRTSSFLQQQEGMQRDRGSALCQCKLTENKSNGAYMHLQQKKKTLLCEGAWYGIAACAYQEPLLQPV